MLRIRGMRRMVKGKRAGGRFHPSTGPKSGVRSFVLFGLLATTLVNVTNNVRTHGPPNTK